MRKSQTRNEPRLTVKVGNGPGTIAAKRAWAEFWERLLGDKAVLVTNKDNGDKRSQQ